MKRKKIFWIILIWISIFQACNPESNRTEAEDTDRTEIGINVDGYISPPSHLLDGVQAEAYISAYAFAELYVNGKYVDRVPTNPDPEYQTYEEIDLIPYLKEGINTIAALVYNAGEGLQSWQPLTWRGFR